MKSQSEIINHTIINDSNSYTSNNTSQAINRSNSFLEDIEKNEEAPLKMNSLNDDDNALSLNLLSIRFFS